MAGTIESIASANDTDGGADAAMGRRPWADHWSLLAAVAATLLVLLVGVPRLGQPFGPAHEGFNAAFWATGADAVTEDGPIGSRLGGLAERTQVDRYGHHPPMLATVLAVSRSVSGPSREATRLPVLIACLASIWIGRAWLRRFRFCDPAVAVGIVAMSGTPMFLLYGPMVDTQPLWLPLGLSLLWAWQRGESGVPGAAAWCGPLAAAGALTAHVGTLLGAGLCVAGILTAYRRRRRPEAHVWATGVGAAAGGLASVGYGVWVEGSLGSLLASAGERSSGAGWTEFAMVQWRNAWSLFGVVALVAVGAGAAVAVGAARRSAERSRPGDGPLLAAGSVLGVCVAVPVLYAVVFRDGATIHEYWNLALLPSVALGAALVTQRVATVTRLGPALAGAAVVVAVVAVGPQVLDEAGVGGGIGALAHAAGREPGSVLYTTGRPADWMQIEAGRPVLRVADPEDLRRVAASEPDSPVLVFRWGGEERTGVPWSAVSAAAQATAEDAAAVVSAAALADLAGDP